LQFDFEASSTLLPEEYELAIVVNRGEVWVLAGNLDFDNPVQLDVSLEANIILHLPLQLVPRF